MKLSCPLPTLSVYAASKLGKAPPATCLAYDGQGLTSAATTVYGRERCRWRFCPEGHKKGCWAVLGSAMSFGLESSDSPEKFVVEVFSELKQETVQERWREVNVLLRLSMLSGVPMQFDATLNLLCDFA